MPKLTIRAPGAPFRVQKFPLYELNFAKNGMQIVSSQLCSGTSGFDTEEFHTAERLVHHKFLPDCFLSNDDSKDQLGASAEKGREIDTERDSFGIPLNESRSCSKFPISKCEFIRVLESLPSRFHFYQWRVVFDTAVDGFSLHHFYRRMNPIFLEGMGGLGFFFIQNLDETSLENHLCHNAAPNSDAGTPDHLLWHSGSAMYRKEHIIGCFTPIVPCEKLISVSNAGSPETFVFRLETTRSSIATASFSNTFRSSLRFSPSNRKPSPSRSVRSFRWSEDSLHHRFMRCLHDGLSIGGGKDGPALWVSKDLKRGTSSQFCETFCCPYLCGYSSETLSHSEFKVIRMLWVCMDKSRVFH